jgi:hypothetical protein
MSPFKSSFKLQGTKQEAAQPDGAQDRPSNSGYSNGTSLSEPKLTPSSSYLERFSRVSSEANIEEMRGNMMLEQLHNEQTRRLWSTWSPGQGVVLKLGRGKYAACPPQLEAESGGLFDQIITMKTRVCSVLLI